MRIPVAFAGVMHECVRFGKHGGRHAYSLMQRTETAVVRHAAAAAAIMVGASAYFRLHRPDDDDIIISAALIMASVCTLAYATVHLNRQRKQ